MIHIYKGCPAYQANICKTSVNWCKYSTNCTIKKIAEMCNKSIKFCNECQSNWNKYYDTEEDNCREMRCEYYLRRIQAQKIIKLLQKGT